MRLWSRRPKHTYDDDELGDLMMAAAKTLSKEPDQRTQAAHLAAIGTALSEARRVHPAYAFRPPKPSFLSRAKSFAGGALATVLLFGGGTMGLAYAGVNLPGTAAEKALERVTGLELPNQSDDNATVADEDHGKSDEDHGKNGDEHGKSGDENGKSEGDHGNAVSAAVHDVKEGSDERGCEFGQAVAEAARDANNGESKAEGADEDKCDHEEGSEEGNALGHDKDNNGHENEPSKGSKANEHSEDAHEPKDDTNTHEPKDHEPNENSNNDEPKDNNAGGNGGSAGEHGNSGTEKTKPEHGSGDDEEETPEAEETPGTDA